VGKTFYSARERFSFWSTGVDLSKILRDKPKYWGEQTVSLTNELHMGVSQLL